MAKGAQTKYDWPLIENEYVTGAKSCREIAEEHGIPEKTVAFRCTEDKWADKRAAYRESIGKEMREKYRLACVKRGFSELLAMQESTSRLRKRFDEFEKKLDKLKLENEDEMTSREAAEIGRTIAEFSKAANALNSTLRNQYGMDVAERRLEMEQENRDKPRELIIKMADGTDLKDYSV